MLTKKGRAEKQIFAWLKRANNSPPEKGTTDKKKGIVYSRLGWQCRREKWSWWWWWWWVRISHADHKSMWQRFGVLRVKHQKVGLFPDDGSNLFCPLMRCEWQVLSYGVCAGDTPPIFSARVILVPSLHHLDIYFLPGSQSPSPLLAGCFLLNT
jgi:hypothetical protein